MATRAGRNDPCPCGSNLKYKRCHLEWDRRGITTEGLAPHFGEEGNIAGYEIILGGERPNPDLRQRWEVPNGSLETGDPLEVFQARVAAFSLDSIVTLTAQLTRRMSKDPSQFNNDLRKAGLRPEGVFLPAFLRRLVTQAIVARELPDQVTNAIDGKWLRAAERVLIDIAGVGDRRLRGSSETSSLGMRIFQGQFHDQLLSFEGYVRELWLNRTTVQHCLAAGLDLESAYKSAFGITYSELAALCFAAWAHVIERNGVIDPALWYDASVVNVDPSVVGVFFSLCSRDYAQFQTDASNPKPTEPGFEPYSFSPLIATPLVRRENGTCVAPIARDLLERPTRGFAVDVVRAIESLDADEKGIFRNISGAVYEEYVRRSLEGAQGSGEVQMGGNVLGSGERNCDFVYVEAGGVTLVEAKAVRLQLRAEMTMRRALLMEEMKNRRLSHGLVQLQASADKIASGRAAIPGNRPTIGLLLVRGELVLLNSQFFRSMLEELAAEELGSQITIPYEVANDEGFSRLTRLLATGRSLNEFLLNKWASATSRYDDLHAVIVDVGDLPQHPLSTELGRAHETLTEEFFKGINESANQTDLFDPGPVAEAPS